MIRFRQFLLLSGVLFFSCGKEKTGLPVFREMPFRAAGELRSVWFLDEKNGFAAGGRVWENGFVISTTDGGETWQTDTSVESRLECLQFDRSGQGYAVGQGGVLLVRPPATGRWALTRQDFRWHRGCFFENPTNGVLVSGEGFYGGELRRVGPLPWMTDTTSLILNELDAVWFSDSTTAHAAGMGWVMRSDDAGRRWSRAPAPDGFFKAMHFPSARVGFICGQNGVLLKTTDAGRSWQHLRSGDNIFKKDSHTASVWFVSEKTGYVVGENGLFWKTENGGEGWQQVENAPSDADFTDVFAFEKMGWATAADGRIFYFEN